MSAPGLIRASGIIAAKDLRMEWRTWETLTASLVFALIVLVIFSFGFELSTIRELGPARLVPGALWIVLAFATIVGVTRSFQLERRNDAIEGLLLAPVDRSAIFLGKLLANGARVLALQAVVVPLSAVLFDYDLFAVFGPLSLVLLLHGFGLTVLGTLFAAITLRVGRGESLLATLLFPAATPLFLSAVRCTGTLLDGQGLAPLRGWLLMSAGFDVLYVTLAFFVFDFVLED